MIRSIYIRNFRSLKLFHQNKLKNVFALIGENSGGKSTVLDAVLVFFGEKNLSPFDFHYDHKTLRIGLTIPMEDNHFRKMIVLMEDHPTNFYKEFKKKYKAANPNHRGIYTVKYLEAFKSYFKEFYLDSKHKEQIDLIMIAERKSDGTLDKKYYVGKDSLSFKDTSDWGVINQDGPIFQSFKPRIAYIGDERNFQEERIGAQHTISSNILNVLLQTMKEESKALNLDNIEQRPVKELSIQELNTVLLNKIKSQANDVMQRTNRIFQENYSKDIEIKWHFDNKLYESIHLVSGFELTNDHTVDFLSIGSGTRSIYLLSLLQAYVEIVNNEDIKEDVLFMIEEPEIYLYPKLEAKMSKILYDISQKNQLFLTTHSGSIIQNFDQDEVYHVKRIEQKNNKGHSKISQLEDLNILIDTLGFNTYPIMDKEYIIFVEGKDDYEQYGQIIKNFFPDKYERTLIISISGVGNIEFALNMQFISSTNFRNKFLIIRDSDCMECDQRLHQTVGDLKERIYDKFRHNELMNSIYCTEGSMLECMTMCPQYSYRYQHSNQEVFFEAYRVFLEKNKERLYKQKEEYKTKNRYWKEILDQKWDDLYDGKYENSSFNVFKTFFVNKGILKAFRKDFGSFVPIGKIKKLEEFKSVAPKLYQKLDKLYG